MTAPCCIDNQLCLNHSCVGAADTTNPAVAIDQLSNCHSALKANIWNGCCSLANHEFKQAAALAIGFQA